MAAEPAATPSFCVVGDLTNTTARPAAQHYARRVDDGGSPRRSGGDVLIDRLAAFLVRSLYRDVDVHVSPDAAAVDGPAVVVSNHFGGVADALVLFGVLPRRPGVVARDVIWANPVVGKALDALGAIPVHKRSDGGGGASNDAMFASCHEALIDGGDVLIFPEGVTRNEPSMAPVKTGAARIALGARTAGCDGLMVVPVGIHYENKAALRSRVFVNIGSPISLDEFVASRPGEVGSDDHDAVHALNDQITVALRRAAPDYDDWTEEHLLTNAAEVTVRSLVDDPRGPVDRGLRDRLANTLADRPAAHRAAICEAAARYDETLEAVGYTDGELAGRIGTGRFARGVFAQLLVGLLAVPFALVGALVNVVPFLIVRLVGRRSMSPSLAATVKPLVAIAAYGLAWAVVIWWAWATFGWRGGLTAFVLLPVYLAAVIVVVERVAAAYRLWRRRRARRTGDSLGDDVLAERRAVIDAVVA